MRKLSGKTINSLALCVALAAPLVYLFGSLFMSLAGAHGEQMFGQGEYTYTDMSVTYNGEKYTRMMYPDQANTYFQVNNALAGSVYFGDFIYYENANDVINENGFTEVEEPPTLNIHLDNPSSGTFRLVPSEAFVRNNMAAAFWISDTTTSTIYRYIEVLGSRFHVWTSTGWTWGNNSLSFGYAREKWNFGNDYSQASGAAIAEGRIIPETQPVVTIPAPQNYSDYIFGQFFAYDNFLAESGRQVLHGTPLYGFEPIGELIRFTDTNMLHLGNLSYGAFVIGYTYYCAHVIIVDLIFYIGSFIPRLIKKTINKLEGGLE